MLFKFVIFLVALVHAASANNFSLFRDVNWPYDNITPFPYRTPSIINFESRSVRLVTFPTPLRLTVGQNEMHTVTNTGCSVIVKNDKHVIGSLTGGVLGTCIYTFTQMEYFWAGNYLFTAAGCVDGERSPLFVRATFRNTKYATDAEACKCRDGYAVIQVNIKVEGYVPNLQFEPFAKALLSITRAGCSTQVCSPPLYSWFDQLNVERYYAYPGSHFIGVGASRIESDSATIIQLPKAYCAFISITQNFLCLRNIAGIPYTNTLISCPAGIRPIIQACGIKQVLLPGFF